MHNKFFSQFRLCGELCQRDDCGRNGESLPIVDIPEGRALDNLNTVLAVGTADTHL
jgi:hypothetical protein